MKSKLIIPATIAAAFHLGLLFGFNRPSAAMMGPDESPEDPPNWEPIQLLPPEPEIEVVEVSPPDNAMKDRTAVDKYIKPNAGHASDAPKPIIDSQPINIHRDQMHVPGSVIEINRSDLGSENGTIGGEIVIGVQGLDRPAQATFQASPLYPSNLRREGIEGRAEVMFVVDEAGAVIAAEVLNSTHREFAIEAERAVRRWKFKPGKRNGQLVRFKMTVPVMFTITDRD